MNFEIDTEIPVSWCLEFKDGTRCFDKAPISGEITEWQKTRQELKEHTQTIRRMHLFSRANSTSKTEFYGVLTPEYCVAYVLIRQQSGWAGGPQYHHHGIGYVDENDDIHLRWYDDGMVCISNEIRPVADVVSNRVIKNVRQTV